jgi:hypothetical protein
MPTYASKDVEQLLADARLAFSNASSDPVLQGPLQEMGVDADYIARGNALVEQARAAYDTFQDEWSDVEMANRSLAEAEAKAQAMYTRHLTLARIAVDEEDPAYEEMDLGGRRKWGRRSGWMTQARQMYRILQTDESARAAVAPYPIDAEAGMEALDAINAAIDARKKEHSEAERSTKSRDAVVGELRGMLRDFLTVAELAFADDRQQLEKLGVTAPSR